MNEQNTREAIFEKAVRQWHSQPEDVPAEEQRAIRFGIDTALQELGAASVDRAEIVRRIEDAKQRLQMALAAKNLPYAQERATEALADLDAVLGKMEKGK